MLKVMAISHLEKCTTISKTFLNENDTNYIEKDRKGGGSGSIF